jgi:arsenate-mycothiol transferase
MSDKPSVLFLCVHNAGKSQMAAAILRAIGGNAVDVHSAGTHPDPEIHGESAEVVKEIGADMTSEVPKAVDPEVLRRTDRVIILGPDAQVEAVEGMRARIERWPVDEPADRGITGIERTRLIRDDIEAKVRQLARDIGVAR